MSEDLLELQGWAAAFVRALSPAELRRLQVRLARDLRRSQAVRIQAQQNPDGTSFEPRKAQAAEQARFRARAPIRGRQGGVRRRAEAAKTGAPMFRKLRTSAFLKGGVDADGVWVGFTGRVARIAAVHQGGEIDRTSPQGPEVRYPARVLLGFTDQEKRMILDVVLDHLPR